VSRIFYCYAECRYAECRYAECGGAGAIGMVGTYSRLALKKGWLVTYALAYSSAALITTVISFKLQALDFHLKLMNF
jgi:hypothetical protein